MRFERAFVKFAIVSGCGWLIDILLTMGLVHFGVTPFLGSAIGAFVAVAFVYGVSVHAIFPVAGPGRAYGLPAYVIWQVFAIFVASVLVATIAQGIAPSVATLRASDEGALSLASGIAKAAVTPLTLLANFIFMRWLTQRLISRSKGAVRRI